MRRSIVSSLGPASVNCGGPQFLELCHEISDNSDAPDVQLFDAATEAGADDLQTVEPDEDGDPPAGYKVDPNQSCGGTQTGVCHHIVVGEYWISSSQTCSQDHMMYFRCISAI